VYPAVSIPEGAPASLALAGEDEKPNVRVSSARKTLEGRTAVPSPKCFNLYSHASRQAQLGHSDLRTTLDIYTRTLNPEVMKMANRVTNQLPELGEDAEPGSIQ